MQTHRFIRKDDLTTGKRFTTELTAGDADRLYSTEQLTLLAMGQTVRIGHVLHLDLNAHVDAHRILLDVMTRLPRSARRAVPQPDALVDAIAADAPSVASSDAALADLLTFLPPRAAVGHRFGKGLL
jgi:hypothetical protein